MTSRFRKVASFLSLILALLLALAVAVFLWYRSASQPMTDGRLVVPGVTAAVDIVRDAEGIPHIFAASAVDAYFAMGFVHAQDRLWQMEMNRRIASGRLAEILGPSAVGADRFLRTLGVERNARRIFTRLSFDTRAALEAYSKGVNAFLARHPGPLPPEFLLTGAPRPKPWSPVDSIGWQTMMAWDLGANWSQELLRMRLSQHFNLAQINELLPPYPGDPVLETQDYTNFYQQLAGVTAHLARIAAVAPPSYREGMGSNNWVVSGTLSATGKPLLANDPHLGLSAPALWYFAHLSAPGLNVIGATLPGIPTVVLGRNDRIAWGFTNTAPDVQDLYIERLHPDDSTRYQTPEGWAAFDSRTEIIKVKGEPDIVLTVRETRHGPVITGAMPALAKAAVDAKQYVVAFAWTALREDDRTMQAGLAFNRARNWEQFLDGARDFSAPQQSMVYADVDGNIGFVAPGRVPVRKAENDLKGLAPAPGWDARYDWNGFIPFDALPRSYNPPGGRLLSANEKIVCPDYPHLLTSEWALPYRAHRIHTLLDGQTRHDLASFAKMQKDVVSLAARELLPVLLATKPGSGRAREALALLAGWDGAMLADSPAPLIFNAWVRSASRQIFEDELGEGLMNDYWEQRNIHLPTVHVLKNLNGQGRWCADSTNASQSCAALLSTSLELALDDLVQRFGQDMSGWQWGRAHQAHSDHRPFSKMAVLSPFFDIRVPTPGDTFTINVGRYNQRDEKEPFANRHAAGLRALYDLSNLENSVFIHATGQSGNLFSPLYRSYVQRWADVRYLPMQTRREQIETGRMGTLTLVP